MKTQLKVPVLIAVVAAAVIVLFVAFNHASSAGNLDQGQVKYTPGVPPWKDPANKGAYDPHKH